MMKLSLALAAVALLALAAPASAGSGHHGYYYGPYNWQYAGPPVKRRHKHPRRRTRQYEQTVQQIRKECRMFGFAYWRYHPDYQHCRYY